LREPGPRFAFGLGALELETAVRHNVAIVIVIANNDGNGGSLRQRMHMGNACRESIMMFQSGLRYDRICEVLGGVGEHVEHARDVGPALERAIASGRPACVNIAIDSCAIFPFD
jgi:thiamine pyrophosphate-dependent acetolactate synthase large subunit-like protein